MVHPIEVYYDGQCPFCRREMRWLGRLDRKRRIAFRDIAAPDFDAGQVGVAWEALMDRIHARLPDGKMIEGVEVFRQLYATLGFRPLVALTRLPVIKQLLDIAYRWFARNRLRLTGRCHDKECRICAAPAGGPTV